MNNIINKMEFSHGFTRGLPIAIGYIPISFTFGLMAVSGGLPVWMAVLISITNVTSAGQFAGTNLIINGAGCLEISLTTFIINLRYIIMSLSLTQRLEKGLPILKRMIIAFGITDEVFSVASVEKGTLSYPFLLGLITGPIIGWTGGTLLGAIISSSLPEAFSGAMGIALYAAFIAIMLPQAKSSKAVIVIVLVAAAITCMFKYIPLLANISSGFRIIIATVSAAGIGALLYPVCDTGETS